MTSSAPRQIGKGYKREKERKRENELRCDADKHTQIQLNSPHSQSPFGDSRLLPGLSLQIQIETQTRAHVPQ